MDQLPPVAGTAQARMASTDRNLLLWIFLYVAGDTRVLDEGTAIDDRIAEAYMNHAVPLSRMSSVF